MNSPSLTYTIPESGSTVEVCIIDTTFCLSDLSPSVFLGPEIKGFDNFRAVAYSFLITHTHQQTRKKTRVLFDLGPPKDWKNDLAPALVERITGWGATIKIERNISEILEADGVPLSSIDAIVWSHPHWDHVGRPSLFPSTTNLIVGPGVKHAFYPGYPDNTASPILSREFAGRALIELDFSTPDLEISGLPAIDFFGDGSLYFFSAPGHAIGHINALARTTDPTSLNSETSTFILMGADSYHHASQLRPHKFSPLPDTIPIPQRTGNAIQKMELGECPGHVFAQIHPSDKTRKPHIPTQYAHYMTEHHSESKTTPFFTISQKHTGETVAVDIEAARATIRALQAFDADPNILLISAHDTSLAPVLDYFPRTANQWKASGWKEQGRWRFLNDLWPAVELVKDGETDP